MKTFSQEVLSRIIDLGSASHWSCRVGNLLQPIRSTTQIWVVTRRQYGIHRLFLTQNVVCFLKLTLRPFDFMEKVGCRLFVIVEFSFAKTLPSRRPGFEETISSISNAAQ